MATQPPPTAPKVTDVTPPAAGARKLAASRDSGSPAVGKEAVAEIRKGGAPSSRQLRETARGSVSVGSFVGDNVRSTQQQYRAAAVQSSDSRTAAGQTLAALATIPGLPTWAIRQADQLRTRLAVSFQKADRRQRDIANFRRGIRKSFFLVTASAVSVAAIADVLSFWDLGWVIAWAIIPLTWLMTRRINGINHTRNAIADAHTAAAREIVVVRQRLMPMLAASGRSGAISRMSWDVTQSIISSRVSSYTKKYVITTASVQVFELIPILDILPAYLGQVALVIIDQYLAVRVARRQLSFLQSAFATLERFEGLELSALSRQLAELVRAYQQAEQEAMLREYQAAARETLIAPAPLSAPA